MPPPRPSGFGGGIPPVGVPVDGIPGDDGGVPVVGGVAEPEVGRVSPSGSCGDVGGIGLPGGVVEFEGLVEVDPLVELTPLDEADPKLPVPLITPDIAPLMLLPGSPIPGRIMPPVSPPPVLMLPEALAIDPVPTEPLAPDMPPEAPPEVDEELSELQLEFIPLSRLLKLLDEDPFVFPEALIPKPPPPIALLLDLPREFRPARRDRSPSLSFSFFGTEVLGVSRSFGAVGSTVGIRRSSNSRPASRSAMLKRLSVSVSSVCSSSRTSSRHV